MIADETDYRQLSRSLLSSRHGLQFHRPGARRRRISTDGTSPGGRGPDRGARPALPGEDHRRRLNGAHSVAREHGEADMRPAVRLSRIPALGTIAIVALALALAGCQAASGSPTAAGSAGPTAGPGALKVVTTTTVFADIVQNVGGSRVAATSIIPPGVGPEDYEPKPDDAKKLTDAKLIVSNAAGL